MALKDSRQAPTVRGHNTRTVTTCPICGERTRSKDNDKRTGGIRFACGHTLWYINGEWHNKPPSRKRRGRQARNVEGDMRPQVQMFGDDGGKAK